ncbi:hypothetical protein BYT27DRAFT_6457112 [Phlegmacium glaucopus]|nr:hypothetical protein BYT27DRAFT_6457112 [Phlegmacium glaucopus]
MMSRFPPSLLLIATQISCDFTKWGRVPSRRLSIENSMASWSPSHHETPQYASKKPLILETLFGAQYQHSLLPGNKHLPQHYLAQQLFIHTPSNFTTLVLSTPASPKYNYAPPPPKKHGQIRKTQILRPLKDLGKLLALPFTAAIIDDNDI